MIADKSGIIVATSWCWWGEGYYKLVTNNILDWALETQVFIILFCILLLFQKYLIINLKGNTFVSAPMVVQCARYSQHLLVLLLSSIQSLVFPFLVNLRQHPPSSPCSLKLDWHPSSNSTSILANNSLIGCSPIMLLYLLGNCAVLKYQCLLSATSSFAAQNHRILELEPLEIMYSKLLIM